VANRFLFCFVEYFFRKYESISTIGLLQMVKLRNKLTPLFLKLFGLVAKASRKPNYCEKPSGASQDTSKR
jgi:hypothetical protein